MKDERFEDFLKDRVYSEDSSLDTTSFWDSLEDQLDADDRDNRKVGFYRLTAIGSALLLLLFLAEMAVPVQTETYNKDFAQEVDTDETISPTVFSAPPNEILETSEATTDSDELKQVESNVSTPTVFKTSTPSNLQMGSRDLANSSSTLTVNGESNLEDVVDITSVVLLEPTDLTAPEIVTQKDLASNKFTKTDLIEVPSGSSISPEGHSAKADLMLSSLPLLDMGVNKNTENIFPAINLETVGFDFNSKELWSVAYNLEAGVAPGYQKISVSSIMEDVQIDRLSLRSYVDASLEIKSLVNAPGIWQLEAGLRYSYLRESFDNHETRFVEEFVNDARTTGADKPGSAGGLSTRETKVIVKKERDIDKKVEAHILEFPIGVGFNIQRSNWNYGAMAGVLGQLRVGAGGHSLIDTKNKEQWRDDVWSNTDYYSLGWYGNMHVGYRIADDIELWTRPYVKQYPNAYSNEELDVDLSFMQAGVKIGATWNFSS